MNTIDAGEIVAADAAPFPESCTMCDPVESVTVSVPFRVPAVFGENTTLMKQVASGESCSEQLFVCKKSPVVTIELTLTIEGVSLVIAMVCTALLLPSAWLA